MNFKCVVMLNFMLHLLLRRLFKFHQAASSSVAMAAEEEDLDEPEYDFSSIFEDLEVVEPSQHVSPQALVVDDDTPSVSSSSAVLESPCAPRIKRRRFGHRVQWDDRQGELANWPVKTDPDGYWISCDRCLARIKCMGAFRFRWLRLKQHVEVVHKGISSVPARTPEETPHIVVITFFFQTF
jgi:hypothetical protein